MKIGISMRGLEAGSFAIQELIQNLTLEILKIDSNHDFFLYFDQSKSINQYKDNSNHISIHIKEIKNRFIFDQVYLPWALQKDNIDIAIFFKGTIPLLSFRKNIVMIQDLGYYFPDLNAYKFFETQYMKLMMRLSATKAWKIFSISQATKNDILRIFKINAKKVYVTYLGVSSIFSPKLDKKALANIKAKYHLPNKYIFFPTSLSPRKNLIRTLKAFNKISDNIPHKLYITGGLSWNSKEIKYMLEQIPEKVILLGNVLTEEMPALYALADFAIYPSLFEGFGVPILEAFNSDCPILTSDITSMPEVAGDAALLVDPYSVDSIAQSILRLATDDKFKASLAKKGRVQAKYFSYKKTAQVIMDTIEKS